MIVQVAPASIVAPYPFGPSIASCPLSGKLFYNAIALWAKRKA